MAILSNDRKYVAVQAGDTLYSIATKYGNGLTVADLARINKIKDPNKISVGEKIALSEEAVEEVKPEINKVSRQQATILQFGRLTTSSNTLFATWEWNKENTGSYHVKWEYMLKDHLNVWLSGRSTAISVNENDPDAAKQDTYTIPDNAYVVRFSVKPLEKTNSSSGGIISSGTGNSAWGQVDWSTARHYYVANEPLIPPVPSIEINDQGYVLAILENLNVNATSIYFQVVKRDGVQFVPVNGTGYVGTTIRFTDADNSGTITDSERTNGYARYSLPVDDGGEYKVRACSAIGELRSGWSGYSSSVFTKPSTPAEITTIRASSKTSVYLEWTPSDAAKSYDIQYATKKEYFDGSDQASSPISTEFTHFTITGLATGSEYFFRVRATNDGGQSEWTEPVSVILGSTPAAPTTWSSSTTVVTGEHLTLYWIHNSEDGSKERCAKLEITIGSKTNTIEKVNPKFDDEESAALAQFHQIDTSLYPEGTQIKWRVMTQGVTSVYGEWSIQRTVDIYARPRFSVFRVTNAAGEDTDIFTSFPIKVRAMGGPITQKPIGYHLAVTSDTAYETRDNVGKLKNVSANEEVYSKYFDISDVLEVVLSPENITLENNITYTITCTVTMNSGLTAAESMKFTVAWDSDDYWPNAEIIVDDKAYTAVIRPYCETSAGRLVEDAVLAVYRRNYDGTFTKLLDNIPNDGGTSISDPHPALDYARYRVVATLKSTGRISYYDMPGFEMGCDAAVIQWDEAWSNYDSPDVIEPVEPAWSGSMVKLPYNLDVSENSSHDVALVKYIGRSQPVSYYGTHLGESGNWSMEIDKEDKDTLYALRRLQRWMGDVYVREPSGVGYWASISVSFSQKHRDVTIPVSISITRVEGGI